MPATQRDGPKGNAGPPPSFLSPLGGPGAKRQVGGQLQRLAQVDCRNLQGFAVFGDGAPCDHESLLRQQFGYAAV